MSDTPKVAVIGAGMWGKNHVRNMHQLEALALIVDPSPETRSTMAKTYPDVKVSDDPKEAFHNPEISGVVIAAPAFLHHDLCLQAIAANKHVLVEKPLAMNISEGKAILEAQKKSNVQAMVGHLLWYHPAFLALVETIKKPEFGDIRYVYSNRLQMGKFRTEENALWSLAPHDISMVTGIMDETPHLVDAHAFNTVSRHLDDGALVNMSFSNGKAGHVFVSWHHPIKEHKIVVVGSEQCAVFEDSNIDPQQKLLLYPHTIDFDGDTPIPTKGEATPIPYESGEPLTNECQHFLDCIRENRKPRTDVAEGLRALTVLEQAQTSIDKNKVD